MFVKRELLCKNSLPRRFNSCSPERARPRKSSTQLSPRCLGTPSTPPWEDTTQHRWRRQLPSASPPPPPFQAAFGQPHPFPVAPPVEISAYPGQQQPKQRIFTIHDLPTRRDLGEAFVHIQNANRSSQQLQRRDIIELQLLEPYLEVWDSFPPLAAQSKLKIFDRVRPLYHVATSGWNTALEGYADPSASYLLGPPARRTEQPTRATSPARTRRNPNRQSRKDNPKKNPPKDDNPNQDTTISPPRLRTLRTPTKSVPSEYSGTWRHTSPPSPLKRTSLDTDRMMTKRTKLTPQKKTPDDRLPDLPDRPILRSASLQLPPRSTGPK
ncbi:unnamed protein product [Ixodes persulcatus]